MLRIALLLRLLVPFCVCASGRSLIGRRRGLLRMNRERSYRL
ncbi:hypothetical protein BURMUCGD2_2457 [Burkholderia multivorans CGD2]|uniref:Uncharacterized protein n=1 Tax=Burkholderia multivorans CGD2 TaxID=513052 RepID=B9BX38_9BURK|nr:hypothetical protein BURMUCGD2_2457 [Burkholderia multivorans CGD2]